MARLLFLSLVHLSIFANCEIVYKKISKTVSTGEVIPSTLQGKSRTFYDFHTQAIAYKDLSESVCYIEKIRQSMDNNLRKDVTIAIGKFESNPKSLHRSEAVLSKQQVFALAGARIVEFCRGFPTYLLQTIQDNYELSNELMKDEDYKLSSIQRVKRSNQNNFPAKIRSQTQSQYLNFGNSQQPGKAEAEATQSGSKAVVSGSSGMGQAQSQSIPYDCEDCLRTEFDRQQQILQYRPDSPGAKIPGQYPPSHPTPSNGYYPGRPGEIFPARPGDRVSDPTSVRRPGEIPSRPSDGYPIPGSRPSDRDPGTTIPRRPGETGSPYYSPDGPEHRPGEIVYKPGDREGDPTSIRRPGELPGRPTDGYPIPGSRPTDGYPIPGSRPSDRDPGTTIPRRPGETGSPYYSPDGPEHRPGGIVYKPGDREGDPSSIRRPGELPGRPTDGYPIPGSRPTDGYPIPGSRPTDGYPIPGSKPSDRDPGTTIPRRPGETGSPHYSPDRPEHRPGEIVYKPGDREGDPTSIRRPGELPGRPTDGYPIPGSRPTDGYPIPGSRPTDGYPIPGSRPSDRDPGTTIPRRPGETGSPYYSPDRPEHRPGEIVYKPGDREGDPTSIRRPGELPGRPTDGYPIPGSRPTDGYPIPGSRPTDGYPIPGSRPSDRDPGTTIPRRPGETGSPYYSPDRPEHRPGEIVYKPGDREGDPTSIRRPGELPGRPTDGYPIPGSRPTDGYPIPGSRPSDRDPGTTIPRRPGETGSPYYSPDRPEHRPGEIVYKPGDREGDPTSIRRPGELPGRPTDGYPIPGSRPTDGYPIPGSRPSDRDPGTTIPRRPGETGSPYYSPDRPEHRPGEIIYKPGDREGDPTSRRPGEISRPGDLGYRPGERPGHVTYKPTYPIGPPTGGHAGTFSGQFTGDIYHKPGEMFKPSENIPPNIISGKVTGHFQGEYFQPGYSRHQPGYIPEYETHRPGSDTGRFDYGAGRPAHQGGRTEYEARQPGYVGGPEQESRLPVQPGREPSRQGQGYGEEYQGRPTEYEASRPGYVGAPSQESRLPIQHGQEPGRQGQGYGAEYQGRPTEYEASRPGYGDGLDRRPVERPRYSEQDPRQPGYERRQPGSEPGRLEHEVGQRRYPAGPTEYEARRPGYINGDPRRPVDSPTYDEKLPGYETRKPPYESVPGRRPGGDLDHQGRSPEHPSYQGRGPEYESKRPQYEERPPYQHRPGEYEGRGHAQEGERPRPLEYGHKPGHQDSVESYPDYRPSQSGFPPSRADNESRRTPYPPYQTEYESGRPRPPGLETGREFEDPEYDRRHPATGFEQPDRTAHVPRGPSDHIKRPGETEAATGSAEVSEHIDGDSQALSSIQQVNNETQASASAQGKYAGGTAQSQVSGSYHGTGTFSASAGTIDGKRGAQTQISGGKDGAISSAQGSGGLGQSQAQVQLASETGEATSSAQTSGVNHGSNTQVQGGIKGGIADAQANAPGATSSQAQIAFTPQDENTNKDQKTLFEGGGTASAQSGSYSGQSQSQLQGQFLHGIKYTGAAQAGTGSKGNITTSRKVTNQITLGEGFPKVNFTSGLSSHSSQQKKTIKTNLPVIPKAESSEISNTETTTFITTTELISENSEYEDYAEYEDEVETTTNTISQKSRTQRQHIILDPLEDLDASVVQTRQHSVPPGKILQPGDSIPGSSGYHIPSGFRGKISSIAGDKMTASFGPNSFAQSVTLSPGTGKIIYKTPVYAVSSNTLKNGNYSYGSGFSYQPIQYQLKNGPNRSYPKFVSVSKSETGSKDILTGQKTPSTFYTQSSTCGFFTNTCVFSGGKKICLPKSKTNSDGTLITC